MKLQFSVGQLLAIVTIAAITCGLLSVAGIEELGSLLWLGLIYAVIASVLTAPVVYATRRRVKWYWSEAVVLVAPIVAWSALATANLAPKSLANLVEPFFIALATPIVALVCAYGTKWLPNAACATAFVAIMCVVAVATYFLVPALPE